MIAGLLPALGGGLGALAATGQASRLIDGYFRPYLTAFERLHYFSYLPESLAEFTSDPMLLERVRLRPAPLGMSRGRRAATLVATHRADVRACAVLRVFQITGTIPAMIARAWFRVPYVTTYGFRYDRLSRGGPARVLKRVVERQGLRRAAAVIAPTEALRARAARIARRVELIPNGVDTARFRPHAGPGARPRGAPRRVLYVGRLSAEKNLFALVTAAALLRGTRPIRLVMVGAGPLEAALRAAASAAGVELELPGVVDQAALPALYATADVFVLASFTEGHPKALLEAMSAGRPCVVSDCEGNRALVTEASTGLVFEPHRPAALAAQLVRVLDDAALAAALGQAARELVVRRYELADLVQREIALLRSVATQSP